MLATQNFRRILCMISPNPVFPARVLEIIKYYLTVTILAGIIREIMFSLLFSLKFLSPFLLSPFSFCFLSATKTLALVISLKVLRFVITPLRGNVLRNSQAGFVTNESKFQ